MKFSEFESKWLKEFELAEAGYMFESNVIYFDKELKKKYYTLWNARRRDIMNRGNRVDMPENLLFHPNYEERISVSEYRVGAEVQINIDDHFYDKETGIIQDIRYLKTGIELKIEIQSKKAPRKTRDRYPESKPVMWARLDEVNLIGK